MAWIDVEPSGNITSRESGQTSIRRYFFTREFGKPTKETEQMTAALTAGAVSHTTLEWHAINWQAAHENVRRLQARIVKAVRLLTVGGVAHKSDV
jgi:hypothetical protein